jgi:hypothetical protein
MQVTFSCPACQEAARAEVAPGQPTLRCGQCHSELTIPSNAFDGPQLRRCIVCPSADLFVRKDFPQRLGVGIVIFGIVASSIAWGYTYTIATFAILLATALADVVLYLIVPNALMCYRCGAQYRLAEGMDRHGAFNLEIHERYRQQAARMAGHSR